MLKSFSIFIKTTFINIINSFLTMGFMLIVVVVIIFLFLITSTLILLLLFTFLLSRYSICFIWSSDNLFYSISLPIYTLYNNRYLSQIFFFFFLLFLFYLHNDLLFFCYIFFLYLFIIFLNNKAEKKSIMALLLSL